MTPEEKVEVVKSLIRQFGNKFLTVDFKKKDGTSRHMMCHRSKVLEASVKGTMPGVAEARRATLRKNGMLCVEELVTPGTNDYQWRTVNCNTVEKVCCGNKVHTFTTGSDGMVEYEVASA